MCTLAGCPCAVSDVADSLPSAAVTPACLSKAVFVTHYSEPHVSTSVVRQLDTVMYEDFDPTVGV